MSLIETFINNRVHYIDIAQTKSAEIDSNVNRWTHDLGLYREAVNLGDQLTPIIQAIYRFQSDKCYISEAAHIWMGLLENPILAVHYNKVKSSIDDALTNFHILAYILNHTLNGERLSSEQRERAKQYLNEQHSKFLPNYFLYLAKDDPFSRARFSESALRTRPNIWWRSLLVSKNVKLNRNFVKFAFRLMSAPATSASLERIFSTFGYVQSKVRNRLKLDKAAKLVF